MKSKTGYKIVFWAFVVITAVAYLNLVIDLIKMILW